MHTLNTNLIAIRLIFLNQLFKSTPSRLIRHLSTPLRASVTVTNGIVTVLFFGFFLFAVVVSYIAGDWGGLVLGN
jgi:hypothetical protein